MDLKKLVATWEEKGLLKRIGQPVSAELEVTEIVRRVFEKKGPALLFENVKGSSFPVAINLFGSHE